MAINIYDKRQAAEFTPLTMQEVLLPAQVQAEREGKITSEYGELQNDLAKLEHLMESEPDDSDIKNRFYQYKNSVEKVSDDVYDNGVDLQSQRKLMEMKPLFNSLTTTIVEAGKLKAAEATLSVQRALEDPDAVVEDISQRSIQDYIDSGYSPLGFRSVSASKIGQQFGEMASILTKMEGDPVLTEAQQVRLRDLGLDSDAIANFLMLATQTKGLTAQEILDNGHLEDMKNSVLRANGIITEEGEKASWVTDEGMYRIDNQIELNKWRAVGGVTKALMGDQTGPIKVQVQMRDEAWDREDNKKLLELEAAAIKAGLDTDDDSIYLSHDMVEYELNLSNDIATQNNGTMNESTKGNKKKFDVKYIASDQFNTDLTALTEYFDDSVPVKDKVDIEEFLNNIDSRTAAVLEIDGLVPTVLDMIAATKHGGSSGSNASVQLSRGLKKIQKKVDTFVSDLPNYEDQLINTSEVADALGMGETIQNNPDNKTPTNAYIEQTMFNESDKKIIFPVYNYDDKVAKKIISGMTPNSFFEINPKTGMPISGRDEKENNKALSNALKGKDGYTLDLKYSAALGFMAHVYKPGDDYEKTSQYFTATGTLLEENDTVQELRTSFLNKEIQSKDNILSGDVVEIYRDRVTQDDQSISGMGINIIGENGENVPVDIDPELLDRMVAGMIIGGNNISNEDREVFAQYVIEAIQMSGRNINNFVVSKNGTLDIFEIGIPLSADLIHEGGKGDPTFIKIVGAMQKGFGYNTAEVTTIVPIDAETSLEGAASTFNKIVTQRAKSYVKGTDNTKEVQ